LIGVGYEGMEISEFVANLVAQQVSRLVDVRLTPISRKPGFSKTALAIALARVGIAYEHHRALGNPKSNRAGFGGDEQAVVEAKARYCQLLERPEAAAALEKLRRAATRERVAVLCFEADQYRCHRDVVLREVAALSLRVVDP
jgi:uncharacterized protein (DUF488 family)